ncbi:MULTISPECIES: M48 family metalloprotease [Cryobacterium]|uniref:Protease HtpX homolog n=1 Tax=Cryobacterium glucosi TaxID=1259175 RepID=A0ABY2IHS0_9MICO|nr:MULTISPECIES: M48 family metalloprotease [Cryobacterium]MDY7526996.1 M48 family metalloprotease [Cryobacterium sp. 10C2]MDY7557205.1 M48 family metalloprotease [Cryobacterium sp. 10C3]MEB0203582.1 M48 family metalloprotease [Cryobacterium sp. 5I3]MEB0287659.1 M48 family metalloprotease [Cryobacterium sp. 10S3]MEB0292291.1 M48 family metalloprotease [Cryobacterium sp. 10C2]
MYSAIARNKRNTVFIIILFLGIIAGLGWIANAVYGRGGYGILILTIVVAAGYALVQYFAAGRQAIAMSGGIRVNSKAEHPRLWNTVENLSITTGTPMPEIYIINDPAPNAFATGRDPQHAIVAATTGLLAIMDDSELEGVMAHELGHVRNYDIRVSMVVFGLVVAVGFISDMFLRMAFFGRNNNNNGNPVVMVFGLVAMIVAPLVASMVQLAVSRQREYLADATSALTTRHPDALASALAKLETYGRPMQKQNTSMAHLWIANPLKPGMMAKLFSTHPPIEDRIDRLHAMGNKF